MTAGTIALRPAEPQDALAVAHLHAASWRVAYRGMLPDTFLDTLQMDEWVARWEREIRNPASRVTLATEGGGIVAFVGTGPVRDADLDPSRVWQVYNLHVAPGRRGGGIGRVLLRRAADLAAAAGIAEVSLWVLTINTPARGFYERCGLRLDGGTMVGNFGGHLIDEVRYRAPAGEVGFTRGS